LNCKVTREAVLYLRIIASGAETFVWRCTQCNRQNPFGTNQPFISKETIRKYLTEEEIAALPVIMPDATNRCVRCGGRTAEMHHWAPRKIFGDKECEQWPKDWLCTTCHKVWHKIVTPQLVIEDYD